MLKIAISGNIASGKSAVEKYMEEKGYTVFDTDKLSHEILNNSAKEVIDAFKNQDVTENGTVSRKKLGPIVFRNEQERIKLENIIYPKLKNKIEEIFEENKNKKFVFISIPLLFEVGWKNLFDKTIFVYADDNLRLERLIKRNSLSKEEALQRINSQKPQQDKIKKSDFNICNNDDIITLQNKINEIIILLEDME